MAIRKKADDKGTLDTLNIRKGRVGFYILGDSPLICNSMSEKAKQELLYPKGRKTSL